jgi:BlaI family transcriptional regulator, penicillinase repressor
MKKWYLLKNKGKLNLNPLRSSFDEVPMPNRPLKSELTKQLTVPTAGEMRLLQILWDLEQATVEEVVNAHGEKDRPNYKTTQTLLRIMEKKGFITHEAQGRVFIFKPLVSRKTIDHLSLQTLMSRNFNGSAAGLLMNLLEASPIKKAELDDLEAYIREYRKKQVRGSRDRK